GERPWSIQATAEEAAAKEFMALDGLGEAAAMALSLTKALGGQRHSSLASLTSWVAAEASRLTELQTFFLDSPEMPEATKRWPAWRHRLVPRILAALDPNPAPSASSGPLLAPAAPFHATAGPSTAHTAAEKRSTKRTKTGASKCVDDIWAARSITGMNMSVPFVGQLALTWHGQESDSAASVGSVPHSFSCPPRMGA
ncbi:hypothetical protein WJX84_001322, partial [Apatococcus fuscideae]